MKAGDLLFYKSNQGVIDKIISWFTGSQYVHVAIQVDEDHKIEMLGEGCTVSPINKLTVSSQWLYPDSAKDEKKFNAGIVWLKDQIGQPYGYEDIVDVIDNGHKFFYVQWGHRDCSHLAVEFLFTCGYTSVSQLGDFALVTPGSLAKFLGVK